MNDRIVIFGGSNIDFIGQSKKKIIFEDSNPGTIKTSYGGVGRNIAETLARLGNDVTFITGIGNDLYGTMMLKDLSDLGIKVLYPKPNTPSSMFMEITGPEGEISVGVCDGRAIEKITLAFIRKDAEEIRARDYLVLDTNFSAKLIADLFHMLPDKKWCVETISETKAIKVRKFLHNIWLLKGNLLEMRSILEDSQSLSIQEVAARLIQLGVKNVVITDKTNPVIIASRSGIECVEVRPVDYVINTTGAGDALFAGIIDAIYHGRTIKEGVEFGTVLSSYALKSESAVNPDIEDLVKDRNQL